MTMRHPSRISVPRILTAGMAVCLLIMTAAGVLAQPQASPEHFLVVFESEPLPESLDLRHTHGVVTAQPQPGDSSRLIAEIPRSAMARDGSFDLRLELPETAERRVEQYSVYVLPGWPRTVLRDAQREWLRQHSLCFDEAAANIPRRVRLDRYQPMVMDFEDGRLNSILLSDTELLGSAESGFCIGDTFEPLEGMSEAAAGTVRMSFADPEAERNTLDVVVTDTGLDRARFECTYTVNTPRDESVPVHLVLRPAASLVDLRGYSWREPGEVEHTVRSLPAAGGAGFQQTLNLAQTPFARMKAADGSWLGVLDHDQTNVIASAGRDQAGDRFIRVSTYLWPRERGHTYEWTFELIGGWCTEYNALLQALAPHTRDFEETLSGAIIDQDRAANLEASYDRGARVLWQDEWFHRLGAYFDPTHAFDARYQTPWGTSTSYADLLSKIEAATETGIAAHPYVEFAGASADLAERFSDSIVLGPTGEQIVAGTTGNFETLWTNPDPRGSWGAAVLRQVEGLLEATDAQGIALGRAARLDSAFELDAYDYANFNGYSSLLTYEDERRPVSSVTIAGREWMTRLRAILDMHEAGLVVGSPTSPWVVRLADGVFIDHAMTPGSLFFMKALSNGKALYLADSREEMDSPSDELLEARLAQARPYLEQGASFTEPARLGRLLYAISEGADYPTLWYFDTGHTRMAFDPEARTVSGMYAGSSFESLDEQRPDDPTTIARGGAVARTPESDREELLTPAERFAQLPRFGTQMFGREEPAPREEQQPPAVADTEEEPEETEQSRQPRRTRQRIEGQAMATEGVPPTYVIGPGDELAVRVWTDRIEHINATPTVDAEGNIYVDLVGAVNVAGETISEVRNDLTARFAKFFDRAQVNVGLARTRVIEVRVTGDVMRPGKYRLSGAVTVFSALYAAGGPSEIGSLRRIRLIRAGEPAREIDLYDYLLQGDPSGDVPLSPEDTVFVAPAGPTVGITGQIQRPARYELAQSTTLPELIEMAGGLAASAYMRGVQVWRAGATGERQLLNVNLTDPTQRDLMVQSGDLVVIPSILEESLSTIEVAGPVRRPGNYQFRHGLTVSGLIEDAQGLTTEAHVEEAYLWRLNEDLDYELTSVDLRAAMHGAAAEDPVLAPGDRLVVLSENEVEAPMVVSVEGAVRNPRDVVWKQGMRVSDLLKQAGGLIEGAYTPQANLLRIGDDQRRELLSVDVGAAVAGDDRENLPLQRGDILRVLMRSEVAEASEIRVTGLVQQEGWYPRPQGMRVSDAILAAGGLTETAGDEVEYTPGGVEGEVAPIYLSLQHERDGFTVEPDPVIHDNDLVAVLGSGGLIASPAAATIRGRVARPGGYALRSVAGDPDTVYELIQRAGGLLPDANPNGIVLYRLREEIIADEQQEDLGQMIAHFNREVAAGTVEGQEQRAAGTAAQVSAGLQAAFSEGTNTVIIPPRQLSEEQWARAVPVDGDVLIETEGEQQDLPLTEGDVVVVPETPTTVTVMGAVVRAGAVPYREGLKPLEYIKQAGDFTPDARRAKTVIIRANGEVTPRALRSDVNPGDIILVPSDYIFREVNPPGTLERVLTAVTSIVSGYLIFN